MASKPSRPRPKSRLPKGLGPVRGKTTPNVKPPAGAGSAGAGTAPTVPASSPAPRATAPTRRSRIRRIPLTVLGAFASGAGRLIRWLTRSRRRRLGSLLGAGLVATAIVVAVIAWPSASGPLPDGVAAQVGPTRITGTQLERAVSQAKAMGGFPTGKDGEPVAAGSAEYREAVRAVMAELVQRAVVHQEALRCGKPCAVSAAEIKKARAKVVKDNFGGSESSFSSFLSERGINEDEVTEILRFEAEQRKLTRRYGGTPKVTEAKARRFFTGNRDRYAIPAARHVSHILLATRAEALKLRRNLDGENFAEQARRHSLDTLTAKRGGVMADASGATGISEAFDSTVAKLKAGEISQPVRSSFGWHLIRVTSTPRRYQAFEKVATQVRKDLRQSIIDERLAKWQAGADKRWKPKTVYASPELAPLPATPATPQAPAAPSAPDPTPQVPTVPDPTPQVPGAPTP